MPCKKSELAQAINTFANARATNDPNLVNFSAKLLEQYIDTLEYAPEDEPVAEEAPSDS